VGFALAEAVKQHTSETLFEEIDTLVEELEGLRAAYEQYFLGIERRPPTQRHDKLKRRVVAIQTTTVKQTAVKFKAQSLNNKLLTYERLWTRTLHEIEDGTYKRDVFKAKLHRKEPDDKPKVQPPPPPAEALEPAPPRGAGPPPPPADSLAEAVHKAMALPALTPPRKPAPSAPSAAPPNPLSETKLRAIYDAYVTAKKRCNEDVSKLTYESVANTLKQQVPVLIKQHKAKSVEFKVVIKDGKAVLRALPKE
jgi:hypothetical protein